MRNDPPVGDGWAPAWWVWTIGQAATLALFAGGVRPSGGYSLPVDATADLGLAVAQLVLAVLLGPGLLGSAGLATRAVAAAVPFTVLATLLAGQPWGVAMRAFCVEAAWIAAFGLARGPATRLVHIIMTVGGPLLWYVTIEYGPRAVPLGSWPTLACPALGVISTRLHDDTPAAIIPPLLAVSGAISVRIARKRRATRHCHFNDPGPRP